MTNLILNIIVLSLAGSLALAGTLAMAYSIITDIYKR